MRWEYPERFRGWGLRGFLILGLIMTAGLFLITWMGYGNCAPPQCWGDPVPFAQAVSKIPKIVLVLALTFVIVIGLGGIRSGDGSE
jgi:hypothetical protein